MGIGFGSSIDDLPGTGSCTIVPYSSVMIEAAVVHSKLRPRARSPSQCLLHAGSNILLVELEHGAVARRGLGCQGRPAALVAPQLAVLEHGAGPGLWGILEWMLGAMWVDVVQCLDLGVSLWLCWIPFAILCSSSNNSSNSSSSHQWQWQGGKSGDYFIAKFCAISQNATFYLDTITGTAAPYYYRILLQVHTRNPIGPYCRSLRILSSPSVCQLQVGGL